MRRGKADSIHARNAECVVMRAMETFADDSIHARNARRRARCKRVAGNRR